MKNKLFLVLAIALVLAQSTAAVCNNYSPGITAQYCQPIQVKNGDTLYQAESNSSPVYTFNHAALVAAGKSYANGSDVYIAFQSTPLYHINLTAWNSTTTVLGFMTQYNQPAANNDTSNYSIFYGGAVTPTEQSTIATYRNISLAFKFGDDFNATTLNASGQWAQTSAGYASQSWPARGYMNLYTTGVGWNIYGINGLVPTPFASTNHSVMFRARNETGLTSINYISGVCQASNLASCGGIAEPAYGYRDTPPNQLYWGSDLAPAVDTTVNYQFYILEVSLEPVVNRQQYWRDLTTNPGNTTLGVGTWHPAFGTDGAGVAVNITYDWVLVRKKTTVNDFKISHGAEESFAGAIFSTQHTSPAYELTNQSFRLYVNGSRLSTVNSLTAFLTWNSTNYTATSVTNTSDQNYTFVFNVVPGVLQVNNSNVTLNYTFRVGFTNGTFGPNQTTSDEGQNLYYAQYFTAFVISPAAQTEGEPVFLNSTIANFTDGISGYALAVTGTWNATTSTSTTNASNYTNAFTAPLIGNATVNITGSMALNLSYLGQSRAATSGLNWSIIYIINITNCSSSTAYIVNFTFFDEETLAAVYSNLGITINFTSPSGLVSRTYNFSFVNVTVAPICVSPAGIYLSNSILDYWSNNATSYPHRNWYHANTTLTTTSPTITALYLESVASGAILTQFSLAQQSGLPAAGYTIHLTRFYPTLNQYLLIAMLKTGSTGLGSTYLRPNNAVQYRFFAFNESTEVEAFDPQTVPCDPGATQCSVSLQLTGDPLESFFPKLRNFVSACTNTSSAGIDYINCTYSDPTATVTSVRLEVLEVGSWTGTPVCDTTSTSVSGSIVCSLGNATGRTFTYYLWAAYSPPLIAESGTLDLSGAVNQYGSSGLGLFIAAMGVIAIGFMGLSSPGMSVILAAAFVLVGQISGLIFLSWAGLVGFLIVAGIAIMSTKN
jgi:hypothetical protein